MIPSEAIPSQDENKPRPLGAVLADYIDLTKPRIITLLLVTTYAAMLIAAGEQPPLALVFFTLLGGTLTSGSANALNMIYDRDIDAVMKRTMRRPMPCGRISPRAALIYALTLGVLGGVLLAVFVNPMASALAISGILFYVLIYTMWLKRSTVQNIVIGGAAGAVPPLVGWVAVTGSLDSAALVLFAFIFLWTPPHFWALAFYKNDDYRAAGVPMLPVIHGPDVTIRHILVYTAILVPMPLLLAFVHPMTLFYVVSTLFFGGLFAWFAVQLAIHRNAFAAKRLFAYSIVYLGVMFGAMVVDRVLLADVMKPVVTMRGISGLPVDHARKLTVTFGATVKDGLPLTVVPGLPGVTLHPNERRQLSYQVTNHSDQPIVTMADHRIIPPEAAGFFMKIECFCFREQIIAPGETVELPLVFSFVDALPERIERISVSYHFALKDDILGDGEVKHDHADHH